MALYSIFLSKKEQDGPMKTYSILKDRYNSSIQMYSPS